MAEVVAGLALASSIVQCLEFGAKVAERLREFESNLKETSNAFSDLIVLLPLLRKILDCLRCPTNPVHGAGHTEEVLAVLKRSAAQLENLEQILSKALPKEDESSFGRRWKAICSLASEKKIKRIAKSLRQALETLTWYQSVHASFLNSQVLGRLEALEEHVRTATLKSFPNQQTSSRICQDRADGKAIQMLPESSEGACTGSRTQMPSQIKRRSISSKRWGLLCLNDRCTCSCHIMSTKAGRFWSWKYPSLTRLFSVCDRATCGNKVISTSFHVSLSGINILQAIDFGLACSWGQSGCSLSLVIHATRIVKYTSPGFTLLWKCETGQLQWPEAKTMLYQLLDEKTASLEDVDPSGETWLEVSWL